MEVDYISKDRSKGKGQRAKEKARARVKPNSQDGRKSHFALDCWSRKVDTDAAKEFVFTIENVVKGVRFGQSGCESNEDGLVMKGSGASVNVCSQWFGESAVEK